MNKFVRIIQFPLIRLFFGLFMVGFCTYAIGGLLSQAVVSITKTADDNLIYGSYVFFTSLVSLIAYYGFVRLVENRPVTELGRKGMGKELGAGLLLGSMLMLISTLILWGLGIYSVTGINQWSAVLPFFYISLFAGVTEEILFRGLLYRILEEWLGSWVALFISAFLFGIVHYYNPNSGWFSSIAIALEAGILFGAIYLITRRLWCVIGLHFSWNFMQGGILGIPVSGHEYGGLLESELTGTALLSGGGFGLEASIFPLILCTAVGIYTVGRAMKQGKIIQRKKWLTKRV